MLWIKEVGSTLLASIPIEVGATNEDEKRRFTENILPAAKVYTLHNATYNYRSITDTAIGIQAVYLSHRTDLLDVDIDPLGLVCRWLTLIPLVWYAIG